MKRKGKALKSIALTLALTGAITATESSFAKQPEFPYTQEDLDNTKAFVSELKDIKREHIDFNDEFLKMMGVHSREEINLITSISISDEFKGVDLSAIKYFTNLEDLEIDHLEVDLSVLQYNQKLSKLEITKSNVTNTHELPNSIHNFILDQTIVKDDLLYIPYNTSFFSNRHGAFTNVKLKNPDSLLSFYVDSNLCYIDLAFLEECPNLLNVTILTCPNIINGNTLTRLNKNCKVLIDDYSPIWLTNAEFNSIPNLEPYDLEELDKETEFLDLLANNLVPDKDVDDFTKIKAIVDCLITNLEYSAEIADNGEYAKEASALLNIYPIRRAISLDNEYDEVCINYACLFQALANRVGLYSEQPMSKYHTWNRVGEHDIDVATLDTAKFVFPIRNNEYSFEDLLGVNYDFPEEAYYVQDTTEESYQELYHYNYNKYVNNNLGYIAPPVKTTLDMVYTYSKNTLLAIALIALLNMVKETYDYFRYRRLENDINEKLRGVNSK